MKKNKISLTHNLSKTIIVCMLAVLLLSGCNNAVEENTNDKPVINHNIDMNPAVLNEDEMILSLEGYGSKGALADKNLTIVDMLMYAVQDEYMAHAEYMLIMDTFDAQKPYSNIAKSEETHLDLLKELYIAYGLDFPEDTSSDHVVVPASLLEAAQTGVQAEIDNIAMYELFLTYDLPENVAKVFTALKNASESHLLAFQKQVNKLK